MLDMAARGRIGGYAKAAKYDREELTASARSGFMARFYKGLPEGLSEEERTRRAMCNFKAHMARLGMKSARKRCGRLPARLNYFVVPKVVGQLYWIGSPNGLIKIGVSRRPQRRLIQLQEASGEDLTILGSVKSDDVLRLERDMHVAFQRHRRRGEWFAVTQEVIEAKLAELGALPLYQGEPQP